MRVYGYGLSMAFFVFVASPNAPAAELPASSLTLEAGKDSADSKEAYLDLDLGFNNGLHLRGMTGRSRQQLAGDVVETRSRLLGISSDYAAPFVVGFDYEYLGDTSFLETRTRRFKLGANSDDWYVQIIYEDRRSQVPTDGSLIFFRGKLIRLPDLFEVNSTGKGVDINYYGFYPWSVRIAYIRYDYEGVVSTLENYPQAAKRFTYLTNDTVTGLESWRRSADLGYNFDWGTLGVAGSQSESVLDKSIASTGSVYLVWDMERDWSTTFTAGKSAVDTAADTTSFGRVALSYRW